jgi:hypothetical protein
MLNGEFNTNIDYGSKETWTMAKGMALKIAETTVQESMTEIARLNRGRACNEGTPAELHTSDAHTASVTERAATLRAPSTFTGPLLPCWPEWKVLTDCTGKTGRYCAVLYSQLTGTVGRQSGGKRHLLCTPSVSCIGTTAV